MNKYKFDCGCEIEIINDEVKEMDGLPGLHIDYENLRLDCPKVWDFISEGHTKGIFQLETNLGKAWSRRILPRSVSEMAALGALLRPGCLRAIVDGKSMTQHYADRKTGKDEVKVFHEALEPLLRETYQILVFQEQILSIAKEIAGFSLEQGEALRKSIGKKIPELMTKVKGEFLEGCKQTGKVNEEDAIQIFEWIEASQRYSFNASHSVSYGLLGYWSAYVKIHFPFHFYTSWLYYAKDKLEPQIEVKQLISDAKKFDISILPPALDHIKEGDFGRFSLYKEKIRFGIKDIKRIGWASSDRIFKVVNELEKEKGKSLKQFEWHEILLLLFSKLSLTVVNGLIQVGALDYLDRPRSLMLFQYNIFRQLTSRERACIVNKCTPNGTLLKDLLYLINNFKMTHTRHEKLYELAKSLREPPSPLVDTTYKISLWEEDLLGVAVTNCRLDGCNPDQLDLVNCTCSEFTTSPLKEKIIGGELVEVKEHKIKTGANQGQNMAFLTVEDNTGQLKCVAFHDTWEENKHKLYQGNTILLCGFTSKRDRDTMVIQEVKNI